jgi:EpsI family protein
MIKHKTFLVSCLCIAAAFAFVQRIHTGLNVEVIEKNIDKFPYKIGDYIGIDIGMEDTVVKELNTDVYIYRGYVNNKGERITLYVGYYGTKKGGRTGHNPDGCYPGGGWSILNKSKVKVPVVFDGKERTITLNSLQAIKGEITEFVYYWYQSQGNEVLASGIEQNLHRFKNKILYNRNDGAFLRVSAPIIRSLSYTENRIQSFIKDIFPLIVKHWPKEREI